MKKEISIGNESFKDLISNNRYYVDKTMMIESIIESGNKAILFPRPRRFGKSLTMSMLDYFFNIEGKDNNKDLFKGLYISSKKELFNEYQGSMPVVFISFKDLKASNFEVFFKSFKKELSKLYKKHDNLYEMLDDSDRKDFKRIRDGEEDLVDAMYGIANLITYLNDVYNKQVLLLIDEYDVPIQEAYIRSDNLDDKDSFYNQVIDFIRTVFSKAAKDNSDSVYKAIFTGVLRVSQESIFSDLNNFEVYGLMDSPFKEYFGFNDSETKELLEYYGLELNDDVKNMYDGYNFNGVNVYNPWSVLKYVSWKKLDPYWVNTSGNNLIRELLRNASEENKIIIENLVQGKSTVFSYDSKLTYKQLRNHNDLNAILNMLFASGYLTFDKVVDDPDFGSQTYVKVPNREVNKLLVDIMAEEVYENITSANITYITNAIRENNKVLLENTLNNMLMSTSFMDGLKGIESKDSELNEPKLKEAGYHLFMLGMFTSYLNNDNFIIESNREAGSGRFDVSIERVDRSYGYVIEFKVAGDDEDMKSVASKGLKQIEEKEYYKELELHKIKDIRKIVIVFKGKKCIVR